MAPRRGKSPHAIKHANKHQKQGKFVTRRPKQLKQKWKPGKIANNKVQNEKKIEEDECDPTDMLESEDLEQLIEKHSTKQKKCSNGQWSSDDENEADFELKPRNWLQPGEKVLKPVLPIKGKSGIVPQYVEVETHSDSDEEHNIETNTENKGEETTEEMTSKLKNYSTVELYANRSHKLLSRKLKIANLATKIIENPQENIKYLKDLRHLMDEKDRDIFITVRKLVSISLLEVFKDILPEYRIRIKTDKETNIRLKKETKLLQEYEDSVLRNYKGYLQRLEKMLQGLKFNNRKKIETELTPEACFKFGEIAVKCLCELLILRPNFNYRNNIIHLLLPLMDHPSAEISDLICSSFRKLFKQDKLGAISLECVKAIYRLLKEKNFNVQSKVLETLLNLRVSDIIKGDVEQKKFLTKKEKFQKMSRKERKRSKHMEQLEKELLETKAEESKEMKSKFQTDVLSQVFLMYFKILKRDVKSHLLSAVLEGLARFSHLINVEFFDDLINILHNLIGSGNLTYRENLHCVQTVFTILSGQGVALNIDPQRFYTHLYRHLFDFHTGISSNDIPTLLTCLDLMFVKRRKQVTFYRILAFIKRLCIVSTQLSHDGSIALLMFVRSLLQAHRSSDILLDTDNSQGNGVYISSLDEPEHCHANATALFELHLLRKHYHPLVSKISDHVLKGSPITGDGQLAIEFSKKTPTELWNIFDSSQMQFKPPLTEQIQKRQGKKRKISEIHSTFLKEKVAKFI